MLNMSCILSRLNPSVLLCVCGVFVFLSYLLLLPAGVVHHKESCHVTPSYDFLVPTGLILQR